MQITKAVITAAGRNARHYPGSDPVQRAMQPLVDRDGATKPVIQLIAEEAIESGIESICVVVAPDEEAAYRRHFATCSATLRAARPGSEWADAQAAKVDDLMGRMTFVEQARPAGYGHAVWQARAFVGGSPFLLLLSDHVYLSADPARRCARQLLDVAEAEGCAASAVQATREHLIHQYGTIAGRRRTERPDLYQVEEVVEKPNPTLAELRLQVPGVRAGHYLCFFGMHALTPAVFDLLAESIGESGHAGADVQLSPALDALARREKYLALEARGTRHNLGVKYGVVDAQIALAMAGPDRERLLAGLLETVVRVDPHAR